LTPQPTPFLQRLPGALDMNLKKSKTMYSDSSIPSKVSQRELWEARHFFKHKCPQCSKGFTKKETCKRHIIMESHCKRKSDPKLDFDLMLHEIVRPFGQPWHRHFIIRERASGKICAWP
jgi:hypothetical protein